MAYRIARLACVLAATAAVAFGVVIAFFAEGVDPVRAAPFVALWASSPFVALLGVELRARGWAIALVLVALGLVGVASSYMSIGGGFIYALLCGPLLLVALVSALAMRPREMG